MSAALDHVLRWALVGLALFGAGSVLFAYCSLARSFAFALAPGWAP